MNGLADAITQLVITRPLTDDDRATIQDILDAASEWNAGRLPFYAFMRAGTLLGYDRNNRRYESAGYARAVALVTTAPSDPRRACLLRAIEELCRLQDVVRTRHGTFTRESLHEHGVTVR